VEVSRVQFIPPALPRLRPSSPISEGWQFELKFDGYRVQLHKASASATMFGRNGGNWTRRFPRIAAAVLGLPAKSCIIDGELIAAGASGEPDFRALLHGRTRGARVYAFDLMEWRGRDIREQPLVQRRAQLEAILKRGASRLIRFSESFPEADALLAECGRRGLEGIVSKRKDAPYRSGTRSGWIKGKTQEWKVANRYRAKLFENQRGAKAEAAPARSSAANEGLEPWLQFATLCPAGLCPYVVTRTADLLSRRS
jgi:bifunctional non-homologous end joining protein LigD